MDSFGNDLTFSEFSDAYDILDLYPELKLASPGFKLLRQWIDEREWADKSQCYLTKQHLHNLQIETWMDSKGLAARALEQALSVLEDVMRED